MKRIITLFLAVFMVLGLFSGCNNVESGNTATPTPAGTSNTPKGTPTPEEPGSFFPLAEQAEFTIWAPANIATPWMQDFNTDVYTYGLLEKATNVHINWLIPSYAAQTETFMLILAGQEYPDMFQGIPAGTVTPAQAIDDDVCLELSDIVGEYMPNYKRLITADPEWEKRALADGGEIHTLRCIYSEAQAPWQGALIRGDWLDDVGMDIPVTYDDLYDVLTAFKNEKGARAPLLIDTSLNTLIANHWIGGFGVIMDFYVENATTVKYGPIEPAFKDALALLAKWYDEDLIDPNFLSNNADARWAEIFSDNGGAAVGSTRNNGKLRAAEAISDAYYMVPMNNPRLNAKEMSHFRTSSSLFGLSSMISTQCEDIPLFAKWLDYCYSDEGYLLLNFGTEGVTFYYDEENVPTIDIDGFNTLIGTTDGSGVDYVSRLGHNMKPAEAPFLRAMYKGLNEPNISTGPQTERIEAATLWLNGDADDWYWGTYSGSLTISPEEANESSLIITDIATLISEHATRIVTGMESVDEWDNVVNLINGMNIDRVIEIRQAAIDRYNAR